MRPCRWRKWCGAPRSPDLSTPTKPAPWRERRCLRRAKSGGAKRAVERGPRHICADPSAPHAFRPPRPRAGRAALRSQHAPRRRERSARAAHRLARRHSALAGAIAISFRSQPAIAAVRIEPSVRILLEPRAIAHRNELSPQLRMDRPAGWSHRQGRRPGHAARAEAGRTAAARKAPPAPVGRR